MDDARKGTEEFDCIYINGKIVTLDDQNNLAQAVGITGDRIAAVGATDMIVQGIGPRTEVVDLLGKTMLPGLIDSHTHLGMASLVFRNFVDGRCPPNGSVKDILDRIRERTREVPKGDWVAVQGSFFGNFKLAERRLPTKEDLDSVAPDNPVVYVNTVHSHVVNSCALEAAGIIAGFTAPPGTFIELDENTRKPTGYLKECNKLLPIMSLSDREIEQAITDMVPKYWVKQGCTSAYSYADSCEMEVYQRLANRGVLPVRVQALPMDLNLGAEQIIDSLSRIGILPGFGNEWLKMGGVKIFVDGAYMGLSAATNEPYVNMPKNDYYGIIKFEERKQLEDLVLKGHNAGCQMHIHAIGDKAQDWALAAYEKALASNPRDHRHRIEHFGNLMTSPDRIRRAREMGIIPITTVEWLFEEGDFVETYLGEARKNQSWPLRSMLDAGLRVANCSDTVGATPFSTNPFYSMWCAVVRRTFLGNVLIPEEAVSVIEALRLYTTNAAYSGFEEKVKGSIEVGKYADLIVINRDILSIPEDEIKDIKVDTTVIGGRRVYQRD